MASLPIRHLVRNPHVVEVGPERTEAAGWRSLQTRLDNARPFSRHYLKVA